MSRDFERRKETRPDLFVISLQMDFKSLMSAQIAKTKSSTSTSASNGSKYQRRAELEREREESYAAEQARLEQERKDRLEKKRKLEDEEAERQAIREEKKRKLAEESRIRREAQEIEEEKARRKRLGLAERPPLTAIEDGDATADDQGDIHDEELRQKLEELGQPAVLDGEEEETHEARLARYRRLTSTASSRAITKKRKIYPGPVPTTIEPLPADEIILPTSIPNPEEDKNKESYVYLHRQISSYLNFLLTEWAAALAGRSEEDAQSLAGVQAKNNYKVVLVDLAPLMRRLEAAVDNFSSSSNGSTRIRSTSHAYEPLPHDALLVPLIDILRDIQRRHYRDATDGYLRLSIGKAAWPIGVTMVGIHERSAREKLHEDGKSKNEVAHIMSDESTRKWLQSLKRCISFAQGRWAPYDIGQLMG